MRFKTASTWALLGILFLVIALLPAILVPVMKSAGNEGGMMTILLIFYTIIPLTCVTLAVIDGVRNGWSILWLIIPALAFLAPWGYITGWNPTAWIFPLAYGLISQVSNLLASIVYFATHRSQRNAPNAGPDIAEPSTGTAQPPA
ncbi:MAG: hypothetical protein SPK50_06440 [Mobiluncus porci]|uniref:hypothetical protein n=1 Tax=Mobiluncus TaxID=2050 RepID=UPI0023F089B0|nr:MULTISPECIES: hypothetical protein [Mobiluncus]MCI6585188.1 hypothetical protein [Mobiluncus sp.]MDD7540626.1 hypothetical protein [Mobiluncus porci]MDY5748751.1 hypothetical protein [Mobiluncus porci]